MAETELGAFVRNRREALSPADVGLPTGGRRRTPGLRRAELATLAGISVDYLIRLEQGRDTRPSASVVVALADALRLDDEDRIHLKRLGAVATSSELCPSQVPAARAVRPQVQALLDALTPTPAYVVNHLSDVLARTDTFHALYAPLGLFDADPPNLLRHTFTDRRSRTAYPDWDRVALEQVATLRSVCADAEVDALVDELGREAGDEFTRRWDALPVERTGTGALRLVHPEVGPLRLDVEVLHLTDRDNQRLVTLLPADEVTAAALDRLSGRRPGALHAVGG